MSIFLQLFLLLDVFLMGALAAVAIRHGYAHFRPEKHDAEKGRPAQQNGHLPPSVREHLLEAAQTNFQHVLNRSADELQKDLDETAGKINKLLDKLGAEIVSNEMEHYRTQLEALRKQTETDINGLRAEVAGHQAELKAKLVEEMQAEKQRLVEQLDTKLADAVSSFLLETLQHNVDLGAQSAYLLSTLEEHKADFTKDIADETPAAK